MNLLKIARVPPVTIASDATVRDVVDTMTGEGAGAVVIVEGERAVGIFTATDLLRRVVARGRGLESTPISEVMTSPLTAANLDTTCEEALSILATHHIRHLPIVDRHHRPRGMLTTRHLLRNMLDNLSHELESLDAYFCADGIGG